MPAIVNTRSCGSGGASALAIGTSSVIASPTVDPELLGERLADDQPVAALAQAPKRARQTRSGLSSVTADSRCGSMPRSVTGSMSLPCMASACRSM